MVLLLTTLCFRLPMAEHYLFVGAACESTLSNERAKKPAWHMQVVNEPDMQGGAAVSKMRQSSSALDKDGMGDHVDQI